MNTYAGFTIRDGAQGAQDIEVIEEVFCTDCYEVKRLMRGPHSTLVVDLGAHIGAFARLIAKQFPACPYAPAAEVVCVEACAENIALLSDNVAFASRIFRAGCYYTKENLSLLNTVFEGGGVATGGSIVKLRSEMEAENPNPAEYRKDLRVLPAITLEQASGGRFIDLLKIDVEGSEINILAHADIREIGTIVGEYHDAREWEPFRAERFAGWRYEVLDTGGAAGRFRLQNPERCTVHV